MTRKDKGGTREGQGREAKDNKDTGREDNDEEGQGREDDEGGQKM